ncbi:hypothetical protein CkaCkLH20_12611 [Colletotrichum karsti]|uniref:HTH cro/C1-type domain-containing protein n=1 Tax=Colletotrichum karsti TaxID=1095194 RepID=A0A9P6HTJ0_9PEZI|nr:uncharacterized protein CkaCkLH20_12611 [Colletotrichum karsti]KAF9869904.1 hypothetical protein CkaCkLH20_12611 [Colletotrichum karsti]
MDQHLSEPRCPPGVEPHDRMSYLFRGKVIGDLVLKNIGDRNQVTWRAQDKVVINYFLARNGFDELVVRSPSKLRELAQLLNVDVDWFQQTEWPAIEGKIASSLKYHLGKLINNAQNGFKRRFDADLRRSVYTWPEELRRTLLRTVCEGCQCAGNGGDGIVHVHAPGGGQGEDHGGNGRGDGGANGGGNALPRPRDPATPPRRAPPVSPPVTPPVSPARAPAGVSEREGPRGRPISLPVSPVSAPGDIAGADIRHGLRHSQLPFRAVTNQFRRSLPPRPRPPPQGLNGSLFNDQPASQHPPVNLPVPAPGLPQRDVRHRLRHSLPPRIQPPADIPGRVVQNIPPAPQQPPSQPPVRPRPAPAMNNKPLGLALQDMMSRRRSLTNRSTAHMAACSDLVDTALNAIRDPEARIPLYATVLRELLPAGADAAALDMMLATLHNAQGDLGQGAAEPVGQLLERVRLLRAERERARRSFEAAKEEASEVMRRWASEGHFRELGDAHWLQVLSV